MNLITDNLIENDIVVEPSYCASDELFCSNSAYSDDLRGIDFIRLFYKYKENWKIDTDIFEFFRPDSLEKLRNKNTILVVDISLEGWPPGEAPIAISLHNSCNKHNVDHRKIFYLTSNRRESICYNYYAILNKEKDRINIVETSIISELSQPKDYRSIEFHIDECKKYHSDRIFLQLSRRNRSHRILANFLVSTDPDLSYSALISQDRIDHITSYADVITEYSPHDQRISYDSLKKWNDHHLPKVADSSDFETNWATNNSRLIYHKTLFSVVLETHVRDAGGTSLFLSEKTFRSIAMRHPLIIFGQKDSNFFLRELGFKTYEQWFDIDSIENETDHYTRFQRIHEQVSKITKHLKSMSIQERLKWRFMREDVLNFNYDRLYNNVNKNVEKEKLHKTIKSLFKGKFQNYFSTDL